VPERVPRNAPAVFNLGAREFTRLFHDGRVELDPARPSGHASPAGDDLPHALDGPLAVQAMFPVTSGTEMAGQPGENPVADAAAAGHLAGPGGVWDLLAQRLRAVPEYVELFRLAYDEVDAAEDIDFVLAANAIAAFESAAWRADDSPFDRYLRGDVQALSGRAVRGLRLFYGKAGCSSCHAGPFQTDHSFHAIAMPQLGPGKGHGLDGREDHGRAAISGDPADLHAFRTPSLRNVALTGPWGHGGAYTSLEAVLRHHLDPIGSLESYDTDQARLPSRPDLDAHDWAVHSEPARRALIASSNELEPVSLREEELDELLGFLHALTDPSSLDLFGDVPERVPSGLPLSDLGGGPEPWQVSARRAGRGGPDPRGGAGRAVPA
jgi:cytochrome c peroxidase